MESQLIIGAASNERYFAGLIGMVVSVLLNTDKTTRIEFHVIDGGIESASWEKLTKTGARINPNVVFIRHQLDLSSFNSFPKDFGGSVLTYARLLFPDLLPVDEMIYLDSDILFLKDIREFWRIPMGDSVLAVCKDPLMDYIEQDCTVYAEYGVDPKGTHFNAGILKINLKKWREENVTAKTIQYIKKHPDQCRFWDQSALNIILFNKVLFLDQSFNFFAEHFNEQIKDDKAYNIHFLMSKKPWLYYHKGTSFDLFYDLMKMLAIPMDNPAYTESFKSNRLKYNYPNLVVGYFRLKELLWKLTGSTNKYKSDHKAKLYWAKRRDAAANKILISQNEQIARDWRKKIQSI